MKKLAIIGGGVAGLTASVYALRAGAEVTLFEQFVLGGLTATISKIENFPSCKCVEGWQLASNLAEQAQSLGLKSVYKKVLSLEKQNDNFVIKVDGEEYQFPSVVVATGKTNAKLGFEKYIGKGLSYCATCDGHFYKNKVVAVIGGNNKAVSEALYLSDICQNVHLVVSEDKLTADEVDVQLLVSKQNVTIHFNTELATINGENEVDGIVIYNGKNETLDVSCVFIATGGAPATEFIHIDSLQKKDGYIVVDNKCESSVKGLFSAGDCNDGTLKQIVSACGDGAKAGSFASAYSALKEFGNKNK